MSKEQSLDLRVNAPEPPSGIAQHLSPNYSEEKLVKLDEEANELPVLEAPAVDELKPELSYWQQLTSWLQGNEPLSATALTPRALHFKMHELLIKQNFTALATDKINSYESPPMQKPLLYKESENSIMFVTQACSDADPSDALKFQGSGGRNITNALKEVMNSQIYQSGEKNNKKIEIFTPMALTHAALGIIPRAHWVLVVTTEEKEKGAVIEVVDSLPLSLGYNFKPILMEAQNALSSKETKFEPIEIKDASAQSSNSEHDEGFEVIDFNILTKITCRGDQNLSDHTSCGYYVIKYTNEYSQQHYQGLTEARAKSKEQIIAAEAPPTRRIELPVNDLLATNLAINQVRDNLQAIPGISKTTVITAPTTDKPTPAQIIPSSASKGKEKLSK